MSTAPQDTQTDPATLANELAALRRENRELRDKFEFLYYWMLRNDETIRELVADAGGLANAQSHTHAAFDHKWRHLGRGTASLENEAHRADIADILREWTGIEDAWYRDKEVLDAGCGDGRFSYAMCTLGANVMSTDVSETALERVTEHCREFPSHEARCWNLLDPPAPGRSFDLALALGVVHHTGDTRRAVGHLVDILRPGGLLVVMVYGYPRLDHPGDFPYMCTKERRRQAIRQMDFDEARAYLRDELDDPMAVRGWFDATTPRIEDHFTYPQIARLLKDAGLTDVTCTAPGRRNLYVRGCKA